MKDGELINTGWNRWLLEERMFQIAMADYRNEQLATARQAYEDSPPRGLNSFWLFGPPFGAMLGW